MLELYDFYFQINIGFGLSTHQNLELEDYKFPVWVNNLGWAFAASSVIFIPILAIIQFIKVKGNTLSEVNLNTRF